MIFTGGENGKVGTGILHHSPTDSCLTGRCCCCPEA